MKKIWRGLGIFFLACCVLVTGTVGVVAIRYPRQMVDLLTVPFLIKNDFLEDISLGQILDGALAGMAESTDDIRTFFLTPEENLQVSMSNQGITGVVGITVDGVKTQEDRIFIREITPGSGAAEAGLQVGDAILEIDGYPVSQLTLDQALDLVRGPLNTGVELLIQREGEEPRTYSVMRKGTAAVESVTSGILKDEYLPGHKIGYIASEYFARNTDTLFDEALNAIEAAGAEALILDLRYNGGGDVEATRQIARRLMADGLLMRLELREGSQEFWIENAEPTSLPLVVLVNGGSASASEILSGAIKDYAAGILVGTQTYGKGSVQSVYDLPTGSGLRITEGRYYLPGGECIDGVGITPDYVVEGDPSGETDPQLDQALILVEKLVTGKATLAELLEAAEGEENREGAEMAEGEREESSAPKEESAADN